MFTAYNIICDHICDQTWEIQSAIKATIPEKRSKYRKGATSNDIFQTEVVWKKVAQFLEILF